MAEPLPMPSEPSPTERLAHEVTHTPPAPWGEHCAAGWGRDFPRYVKNESHGEFPVIQCDYCYLTEKMELAKE
eukprot:6994290-Alexandrium_andersonii.AAC.1